MQKGNGSASMGPTAPSPALLLLVCACRKVCTDLSCCSQHSVRQREMSCDPYFTQFVYRTAYSITSSARQNTEGGMVMPSSFAVFRLTKSLNNFPWSIAKSPGPFPFKIWST